MRRIMDGRLATLAIMASLSIGTPGWAQSTSPGTGDAQSLAIEGMEKILKALDLLIQTIPQYAAPEVLENGDIIIRRLHPEDKPKPLDEGQGDDETDT